jgi:hypothetical protein
MTDPSLPTVPPAPAVAPPDESAKKPFVEPTVSAPQDVLEATTSFALALTGVASGEL